MEQETKNRHTHSHLKKLIDSTPSYSYNSGILSQPNATKTFSKLSSLIHKRVLSNSLIYLTGQTSSSKTALVYALSSELGDMYPFVPISAVELNAYLSYPSKILDILRQAIGVRLREIKETYEGEVVSINFNDSNEQSHFSIMLRSSVGVKKISLDNYSSIHFKQQNILPGDVIMIEVSAGSVHRLGRCDNFSTEYDLECERYVPLPKGEVYQRKFGVKDVTLYEIDKANNETASEFERSDSLVYGGGSRSIGDSLRYEIDKTIKFYETRGNAQIYPGLILIRDAHLLNDEAMEFIVSLSENKEWIPNIIFVSSRPFKKQWISLRSKFMFMSTQVNSAEEISEIAVNKLAAHGINLKSEDKTKINAFSEESGSVAYCVQKYNLLKSSELTDDDLKEIISGRELIRRMLQ